MWMVDLFCPRRLDYTDGSCKVKFYNLKPSTLYERGDIVEMPCIIKSVSFVCDIMMSRAADRIFSRQTFLESL
jgi:hypothetical protein